MTQQKKVGRVREFAQPAVVTFKMEGSQKKELMQISGLAKKFRVWAEKEISKNAKKTVSP